MPKDFGYINARIRGMKSKLLGPDFYDSALDATDFPAFLSVLSSSSYMRDIEESQSRFEGLKIVQISYFFFIPFTCQPNKPLKISINGLSTKVILPK